MIVGNDISEWQGQIDWGVYKQNTNFVIVRTSFGLNYIDKWFGYNRAQARIMGIPLGYYHFCKPDLGNSPQEEAKFFCSLLDGDPIKEGEIICLDFEVNYADAVNWCKAWLDAVSNHFGGMKLFIYLDQSKVKAYDWSPVVNAGHKLWLASYNPDGVGDKGKWDKITMQQWTSSQGVPGIGTPNVDGDHFFGSIEDFKQLGYKRPASSSVSPSISPSSSASKTPSSSSSASKSPSSSISRSPSASPSPSPEVPIPQPGKLAKVIELSKEPWSGWFFSPNYWKNKYSKLLEILNG